MHELINLNLIETEGIEVKFDSVKGHSNSIYYSHLMQQFSCTVMIPSPYWGQWLLKPRSVVPLLLKHVTLHVFLPQYLFLKENIIVISLKIRKCNLKIKRKCHFIRKNVNIMYVPHASLSLLQVMTRESLITLVINSSLFFYLIIINDNNVSMLQVSSL